MKIDLSFSILICGFELKYHIMIFIFFCSFFQALKASFHLLENNAFLNILTHYIKVCLNYVLFDTFDIL